ncbi:hypothetical protein AB0C80_34830, partial [Streptomyces anthocyanicus]|uniref:hypothetical protein n=1 Tax=Streptomyces anthocyanicus TaxID=68174 RepID=UPI0034067618
MTHPASGRHRHDGPQLRRGTAERGQDAPGAGLDEGQVEDVLVVDRVEGAGGEEGEVLAVQGE